MVINLKIALLCWGALYWNCKGLKFKGSWNYDGPRLPIEFARKSDKTPLTLVLYQKAPKIQTLWNRLDFSDLSEAVCALATREGTPERNIGFYSQFDGRYCCNAVPDIIGTIKEWVKSKGLDAVVWTDLGSNYVETVKAELSAESVYQYINGLDTNEKIIEKEYVIKAHPQIDTPIRCLMKVKFGWRSLAEYQQGFWLNRNLFIVADKIELRKVKREDYTHGTQEAEMLFFTNAVEMLVDSNGKILGEIKKPQYGIWLDVANKAMNQYESKLMQQLNID